MNNVLLRSGPWLLLLLVAGTLLFPSAGRDDVHITYWAAYALNEWGAIVNYNGAAVEQSSSLLHVLLLAAAAWLSGLDVVDIGSAMSVFFGLLTLVEALRLTRCLDISLESLVMVLLVTATPFLYWSFGGLETSLAAYLITAFVRCLIEWCEQHGSVSWLRPTQAFFFATGYLLTRPEAVFVLTAFLTAAVFLSLFEDKVTVRRLLLLLAALWAVFACLVLWRFSVFGSLFPQPVYAKVGAGLFVQVYHGLRYLIWTCLQVPSLLLFFACVGIAALAVLYRRDFSPSRLLPLLMVGSVLSFVVFSGGDWMEGARFVAPVVALMAIVSVQLVQDQLGTNLPRGLIAVLVVLGVVQLVYFAKTRSTAVPVWQYAAYETFAHDAGVNVDDFSWFEIANRVHLRDAIFIEQLEVRLQQILREKDKAVIMSAQGGMVPFHIFRKYFGRLHFIDLAGLITSDFTDCAVLQTLQSKQGSGGVGLNHRSYLEHRNALHKGCGIPYPDLLFDVDNAAFGKAQLFEDSPDFEVIYKLDTDVCVPGRQCPPSVEGNMFLAAPVLSGS